MHGIYSTFVYGKTLTCWGNSPFSICMLINSFAARYSGAGSCSTCPQYQTLAKQLNPSGRGRGMQTKPAQRRVKLASPVQCWLHVDCHCQHTPVQFVAQKKKKLEQNLCTLFSSTHIYIYKTNCYSCVKKTNFRHRQNEFPIQDLISIPTNLLRSTYVRVGN